MLARREEAIPPLLQILEQVPVLCANEEWDSEWMIHEYALYLLSEFARGSALDAIGILFQQGRITRSVFECCLMELHALIELEPAHVWDAWISLVTDFRCTFLLDKVRTLYERGFADPGFQALAEVEAQFPRKPSHFGLAHLP